jgi:phospho-N-acetylmuramoyl-pentapeptide-transferase
MQIIVAAAVSFFVAIFLTPVLIKRFSAEGIGQEIREEGPKSHLRKRGTPTMGGIAILVGITVGYLVAVIVGLATNGAGPGASGWLVLGLTLALGGVGFADDYIKLVMGRNLGLNARAKLALQLIIAVVFGILILQFPNSHDLTPASTKLSFIRDINTFDLKVGGAVIGTIIFLVFIYIVISAWSNAVNLTDGLDGLAAGVSGIVLAAYVVMTFWQFRNSCSVDAAVSCYQVRDPLDLAMLTGSLALGGLVAGLSITSRTELLMIVVAFLFVMEAASVVIQVGSFKTTGRRVFRMAPFHHHFEQGGWAETTVVVRFWLLSALFAMGGVALFYSEWLRGAGL